MWRNNSRVLPLLLSLSKKQRHGCPWKIIRQRIKPVSPFLTYGDTGFYDYFWEEDRQPMKIHWCTSLVIALCSVEAYSQTLIESNLPIIIITTDGGVSIPDEPKVKASMKLIYHGPGELNYVTDKDNPAYLDYNGRIGIEIRGSSSQVSPKKNYGFTTRMADDITNNNVSLVSLFTRFLFMPSSTVRFHKSPRR